MDNHRLYVPGSPVNWRIRESLPEGERIMLLGTALLLGRAASQEDPAFAAMLGSLTAEIADNDAPDWGELGEGVL